ncbi:adenylate/guanylate cyclase domain-containing protein [Alkanindiges illinoisensis]|uniref:Adenylate/guanylate cyclase domain-containing protein n=1 Tax=Alkanindiges illinoisensis TaxID=197183 RepID=A0A4Y7XDC9_9GAMM|nr:adenylate/guanylate cyclase domain-containing protein [Alkanindiges illinoisensis]TEU27356.1 adenylate/guanylate cyclase domain-containing protein [Alkanindiges illinoisensis]
MLSFDILNKDPLQFARYHRYVAYFLILIIFLAALYSNAVHPNHPFVIITTIFLTPFIQNYSSNRLIRRFGYPLAKNIILLIDALFVSFWLISIEFAVIPSLLVIIGLIYGAIWVRVGWLGLLTVALVSVSMLYLFCYLLGINDIDFKNSPMVVSVISILCLTIYLSVGLVYFNQRLHRIEGEKKHVDEQVTKYLTLANKLARYAPSQIWQSIIRGDHEAKIDNKRKKLTIFFSDIQGFTELSEKLLPDDLAFILNDYFEHMTDIARRHGGTVDKYMGDAILIFFGDPESKGYKEDAKACIYMAMAMLNEMKILRERWKRLGYSGLHIRIGINTGYCHVGNFGTSSRMSYTIVGRDANLAARLQTAAEIDQILISESTYQLVKDSFTCLEKGELQLKGLSEPVLTWQIVGRQGSEKAATNRWIDYELQGFHLQLDLNELKPYEGAKAIQILEQVTKRLKMEETRFQPQDKYKR